MSIHQTYRAVLAAAFVVALAGCSAAPAPQSHSSQSLNTGSCPVGAGAGTVCATVQVRAN